MGRVGEGQPTFDPFSEGDSNQHHPTHPQPPPPKLHHLRKISFTIKQRAFI